MTALVEADQGAHDHAAEVTQGDPMTTLPRSIREAS